MKERRDRQQSGSVLILVAVMIVMLIGFASLVIDMGSMFRVRNELQNASDSAALAGAQELDRTADGIDRARDAVRQYAALNLANGSAVVVPDEDIIFGHWDEADQTFTSLGSDPADPAAVNAVQVLGRRETAAGNQVQLALAPVLGRDHADINAGAVGVGGGPAGECGFPMVVADCALDSAIADGTCDYCMVFQDNNGDNAGWTSFDTGSVGVPTITGLVEAACYDESGNVAIDPSTGECSGTCTDTHAGDEIQVNNGNMMNQGNNNFCPLIQDILRRGVPNGPAIPFTVRVPVLQSTSGTCDASQFSGTKTIAGYAAMEIYGAKCGNGDPGIFAPGAPCSAPASGKYIVAALRCDLESDGAAGGGFFGVDSRHVRLVR